MYFIVNLYIMANTFIFKGLDLKEASIFDVAKLYPDFPPFLISPVHDLSDEDHRIFSLYSYAEEYKLTELKGKLKEIYKNELALLLQ